MPSSRRLTWTYHSPRLLGFLSVFDPTGRLLRKNNLLVTDPGKFPELEKILTVRPQIMTVATWMNATMTRARRAPVSRYSETERHLPDDDAPRPRGQADARMKMFRNRGPRWDAGSDDRRPREGGDTDARVQSTDQEGA
ncbi:hypothetical protein [Actinoplanes sp. NPDC051494]|uniref:hypothetical protein n=1 Tax=Actinoplanes sp. NPDC051494 TaxID=3363907 RepID=UPI0037BBA4AE